MTEHELRCWPEHYAAVEGGRKTCELRLNDRPYAVGDALYLREYEPLESGYTGAALRVRVTHILNGGVWLSPGYIAMSIRLMGEDGGAREQEDFRKVADAQRAELAELRASATLATDRCKALEAQKRALLARIAQLEGVQDGDAPLGVCARCARPLDNLSPGISIVAGGVSVCTSCLRPGETEIARAR